MTKTELQHAMSFQSIKDETSVSNQLSNTSSCVSISQSRDLTSYPSLATYSRRHSWPDQNDIDLTEYPKSSTSNGRRKITCAGLISESELSVFSGYENQAFSSSNTDIFTSQILESHPTNIQHFPSEITPPTIKEDPTSVCFVSKLLLVPEGDWGWTIALCGFLNIFLTQGFIGSYGVIFLQSEPDFKRVKVYCFAIAVSISIVMGPLFERVSKRIGCRPTVAIGGFLMSVSIVVSVWFNDWISELFTLGFIPGIATALCITGTQNAIFHYFHFKKPLADFIWTSGLSSGLILWPVLTKLLIDQFGLQNTRLISGVIISCIIPSSMMYRNPLRYYRTIYVKNNQFKIIEKSRSVISEDWRNFFKISLTICVALTFTCAMLTLFIFPFLLSASHSISQVIVYIVSLSLGDQLGRICRLKCSSNKYNLVVYFFAFPSIVSGLGILLLAAFSSYVASTIVLNLFIGFGLTNSLDFRNAYAVLLNSEEEFNNCVIIKSLHYLQGVFLITGALILDFIPGIFLDKLYPLALSIGTIMVLSGILMAFWFHKCQSTK